jgi:hypothetical protein
VNRIAARLDGGDPAVGAATVSSMERILSTQH